MKRFALLFAIFGTVAALSEGDECRGKEERVGVCRQVGACDVDWTYGDIENPVCGEVTGVDVDVDTTLVCCHIDTGNL